MFADASLGGPVPSVWADLGAGEGTFTKALAEPLAGGSTIHAIDRDAASLARIPSISSGVRIKAHVADFVRSWPLDVPLDGILMANALHFIADKAAFLSTCVSHLSPHGRFLVVEYDIDRANPWVPYPIRFAALAELFAGVGFEDSRLLATRRSVYQRGQLYSALIRRVSSPPPPGPSAV